MWLLLALASLHDVRIVAPDREAARALAREQMTVYDVRGNEAFAYAPEATIAELRARGFVVHELYVGPVREGAYKTPDEINSAIQAIAASGPFHLETLGHSVQGVPILGLRMGTSEQPAVRILGGHHGDEPPSAEFPLRIAEALAANPPSNLHVLIVPMVNPDGLAAHSRYNKNGVDLNRNYGFAFAAADFAAGAHAYSEPEVRAVTLDNEYQRYAVSLTFHAGAFNIGYPYNYTTAAMSAESLLRSYGDRYKAHVADGAFEVLRGAEWFISHGDTNDYTFGYFGGADLTVELSAVKAPMESALAGLWQQHLPAALDWLHLADSARVLHVTDASDGTPLPAFVHTANVTVAADPVRGVAQLHEDGAYTLSYPGYVQTSETTLAPTDASVHARALLPLLSAFKDDTLILPNGVFAGVRAIRAGSDEIAFACTGNICVADAEARRPGHYDLVATFADGSEGCVRNALLLREVSGTSVSTQDGFFVTDKAAWLVERGGGVRLFADGRAPVPADTSRPVDVVWREDGALVTQTMWEPTVEPSWEEPPPNSDGRRRGCSALPMDGWLLVGLAYVLRWRLRSIRTTI